MSHESSSESDSDEEEENYPNEVSMENAAVRDQDNVVEANAMEKYQDDVVGLESISIDIVWFRKWFWNWRQGNE